MQNKSGLFRLVALVFLAVHFVAYMFFSVLFAICLFFFTCR